ncbi:AAA family ATPase [Streptosporangiaceae bacterium NEAU-GS5]|nr:AAA family ATPase [Streptosporangiaceae bacterium NEAU-GS5]
MTSVSAEVMVGRTAEVAAVRGLVDGVRRGRGGLALVIGEAGIGKTRLLRESTARAREAGLTVMSGRAVEGGGTYRPILEALAGHLPDFSHGSSRCQSVPGGLLPGWTNVDQALVLGEGLLRLLREVSGDHGCLMVLDDMQWADADTLALLEYLAAATRERPILIMASASADGPPSGLLSRVMRGEDVTTLRLGRLTTAEVEALAGHRAGRLPLSDAWRRFVVDNADGLPYMVEELVAGALEADPAADPATGRPAVPHGIVSRVTGHLAALEPEQRSVLEALAVLGGDPDWTLLSAVTGLPEPVVLSALRAATPRLLTLAGDELRWRHTLTREAVLTGVTPPERAAVARRAADALLGRGEPAGQAYAAELLASAGEGTRAAAVFLGLARRDMDAGALRSARDHLDRASATRASRPVVAIERVRLLTLLGQAPDALEAGAGTLGEVTGDQHAELCLRLAEAAIVARRWDDADRYLERAGRPHDPRAVVLAADSAFGAGDLRRAAGLAAVAAGQAEQYGRWETLCRALTTLGRCAFRHDVATARQAYVRAAQTAAEHGLAPARVTALLGLGAVDLLDQAGSPALREARELARRTGLLAEVIWAELLLVDCMVTTEGPRAARAQARGVAERAGRLRLTGMQSKADLIVATAHALEGDVAGMEAVLARTAVHADPPVEVPALAQATRGLRHLLSRDLAAACALFDDGMSRLDGRAEAAPVQHWGLWALLRTVLADRDSEARETVRRSPAVLRVVNLAGLWYADAVAEGRAGRSGQAAALFADADRALAEFPWWRRLLRLIALEAAIADGWGDPVRALRADLEAHVHIGETHLARVCRDLLRGAGAPTRRGRGLAPVPTGLRAVGVTNREMDVLGLLTEGLTNRKIAERLVISPRTVDTHVANLLAKTGAADRTELRTLARR